MPASVLYKIGTQSFYTLSSTTREESHPRAQLSFTNWKHFTESTQHYLKIQTKYTVHHVLNTLTTQQPDPVQQVSTGALSKSLFSLDSKEMHLKGLTSLKNT